MTLKTEKGKPLAVSLRMKQTLTTKQTFLQNMGKEDSHHKEDNQMTTNEARSSHTLTYTIYSTSIDHHIY